MAFARSAAHDGPSCQTRRTASSHELGEERDVAADNGLKRSSNRPEYGSRSNEESVYGTELPDHTAAFEREGGGSQRMLHQTMEQKAVLLLLSHPGKTLNTDGVGLK